MRRLLSRGGLVWVAAGLLVYACGGDARRFVNGGGGDDEGGDGSGGTNSGGTSGGGKGGTSGSGTSGDSGAAGDAGTTSTGGTGNRGGTAGTDGGMGGEPEPPPPPGRPGTALVAGGMVMTSTNYRLFVITGNGSLPANSSSTNYSLRGGIVGTTQP
jgi:hypothetical protein